MWACALLRRAAALTHISATLIHALFLFALALTLLAFVGLVGTCHGDGCGSGSGLLCLPVDVGLIVNYLKSITSSSPLRNT